MADINNTNQQLIDQNYYSDNPGDSFIGFDTNNNPLFKHYWYGNGDGRFTARSEERASLDNWNMMMYQNNYNDPSNQVKRLEDAGLNPLYFLGQNAGTTPAAAGGNAQGHQMSSADGAFGQMMEAGSTAADTLLNTQKQAWEYDIAKRQLAIEDRKVGIQEAMLPYNQSNTESSTNKNLQDVEESKTRQEVMNEEINNLKKDGVIKDNQAEVLKANVAYIEQQTSLAHEMMQTESTKRAVNRAQAQLFNEQSTYYKEITKPTVDKIQSELKINEAEAQKIWKEVNNIMADTNLKNANAEMVKLQARLTEKYGDAEKVCSLINSLTSSWNNFCSGVHHSAGAAKDIVSAGSEVMDYTPLGMAKNVTKSGSRAFNNTHSNPRYTK